MEKIMLMGDIYRTGLELFQNIIYSPMPGWSKVIIPFLTLIGLGLFSTRLTMFRKRDPSDDLLEFVEVSFSVFSLVFFVLMAISLIARKIL